MSDLLIPVDSEAFKSTLQSKGKSLNWAREVCGMPRRPSDEIKEGKEDYVDVPVNAVLRAAAELNEAATKLTRHGAFRDLALLNADRVGMVELTPPNEPYQEVIAERVTLEGVRREMQYHREVWEDSEPRELSDHFELGEAEASWIASNRWTFEPNSVWERAISEDVVAGNGALLRRIDEAIMSKPKREYKTRGARQTMEYLVSEAESLEAARDSIKRDLCYPREGFAIFHKTVVRYLKPELEIGWEDSPILGTDEDGDPIWGDDVVTILGRHDFSTPALHITHYLVVAPHDTEFVYLRVPPPTGKQPIFHDIRYLEHFMFEDDRDRAQQWLNTLTDLSALANGVEK